MEKSELKEVFLGILKPFFKNKGYTYQFEYISKFQLKTEKYIVMCYFDYLDRKRSIRGGILKICLWNVENIILEIQYPMQDFSAYLNKDTDFFSTVNDFYGKFNPVEKELNNQYDIIEYAETVKQYIDTDGQKFINYYSYLPNVLKEMDKLESEGKHWYEILSGGPEYFFRGLIISKLCNDKKFKQKLQHVDMIFYDKQYKLDMWIPYYKELKERLKTIEPM